MRRSKGLSLIEVLIAGAVLLIMLFLVADLFTTVYRHQRRLPEEITQFRQNALAVDRVGRELRQVEAVLQPDLATAVYGQSVDLPFSFSYHSQPGLRQVEYRLDAQQHTLTRFEGPNQKVVARGVESCTVTPLDPATRGGIRFLRFNLTLQLPAQPNELQLEVALERP